jgi:uncharacterized protein (DUF924 family)
MQAQTVLDFWFKELTAKQHFAKDAALDEAIRSRFGATLDAAARCELFAWRATPEGRLAEIILEKAVGCARVCRARRVQQGATTQWALAQKEEQRSWARRARCNRVHSVLTQEVRFQKGRKVNFHAGKRRSRAVNCFF